MRFVELRLSNFKRFEDLTVRFSSGLTLLWGPNESGKSTVHQAISCALFGREKGMNAESWNGGKCVVSLMYRTGGKTYCVERRLSEGAARLGVPEGEALTNVVTQKSEIERLIAEHLGITSRQVFENTVSVSQMGMSKPDSAQLETVGGEIQRILTGTARFSASEVLGRLQSRRNDVKGTTRPANPREYDRISERLKKLADDLAKARDSRQRIADLEEECSKLTETVRRDSERLQSLQSLQERYRRWSELKGLEAELDKSHEDVFSLLQRIRNTLADLKSAQKEMERYTDLVGRDDEIAEHLAKIEARRAELQSHLTDVETVQEREPAVAGFAPAAVTAVAVLLAAAGLALGVFVSRYFGLLALPALYLGFRFLFARTAVTGRKRSRLAELAESYWNDLKQLEVEEQGILNVIGCTKVQEARDKIESYRELSRKAHELEIKYTTLLDGRKIADVEKREEEVGRELSLVRNQLKDEFTNYSPSTEEAESWRSEFANLESRLKGAQERLGEVNGALEAERRNARDLPGIAALEGELEYLHARKDELEFVYKAYGEAIAALETVTQTVSEEYLPTLSRLASEHLRRITSGRYTQVCISPKWKISLECTEKSGIEPAALSLGTLDQLYLALRIACGELLSGQTELPVILDDPFAAFDQGRLENALELLTSLAGDTQILLMTHDQYVLDWARELESSKTLPCAVYELPPPAVTTALVTD